MLKRSFKGSQAIESIRVLSPLTGVQGKVTTQTIYDGNSHSVLELSGKVYRRDLLRNLQSYYYLTDSKRRKVGLL